MQIIETTNLDTLARLNRYVHEPHVAQQPDFFKPYDFATVRAFFAKMVGKDQHQFLIAELDGEAIGYVWIEYLRRPESAFNFANTKVRVHHLCIVDDKQQQGFGRQLLLEVERRALAQGIHKIDLDYWMSNDGVDVFYERLGFEKMRQVVAKSLH
ncbi:N-acetyltransferase family protein [Exiguobacterium artemiae]